LWLAQGPLPMRRLAQAAGLDGVAEARELLGALRRQLAIRQSAIEVVEVAGGVRLMTRPVFEPWLAKLAGTESKTHSEEPRLSGPALEALAIVAYRQPAVRAEVEAIRGVGCGELLRQLLEADLLRIVGRSEELGKPLLYGTTDRFLEVFGLRNLDGLPQPGEAAEGPEPTKQNAPSEWVEA
jgi:segregation and condensation protein B